MGYIYFIATKDKIKIGFTKNPVEKRLKQLQTGNDENLVLLGYILGELEEEQLLHKQFAKDRIRHNGEWFFPSEELVEYINKHNAQPNTYVDWVDGRLLPLLKISKSIY